MPTRSLVIGASGQVGGLLAERCRDAGQECLGTASSNPQPGLRRLDLRDGPAVAELLKSFRPDVVFLPAALTHVDYCEAHPDECRAINVAGTAHVAREARAVGATLVFFSTEHVFSDSETPLAEDGPPAPKNVYSRSKVDAERLIRELVPDDHLILRASWVFGPERQQKNFVHRAVRALRRGEPLVVPADQYGQPTYAPDLAATTLELLAAGQRGTFHAVGPECVSRLAFAQTIAGVFALDGGLIRGVPTSQLGQPAPRPLRVPLRRTRLIAALGKDPIRNPSDALREMRPLIKPLAA